MQKFLGASVLTGFIGWLPWALMVRSSSQTKTTL